MGAGTEQKVLDVGAGESYEGASRPHPIQRHTPIQVTGHSDQSRGRGLVPHFSPCMQCCGVSGESWWLSSEEPGK